MRISDWSSDVCSSDLGGTAIDRWIVNDRQGLFDEPQQRAIRYTQNLWLRVEGGLRAVDTTADVIDSVLGWSQQEALVELKRIEARVPRPYWDVYQNRSEEHTSELQSLMRISYAVFCLKKKKKNE